MDNQVVRVLKALCLKVGTPRAAEVLSLARSGEWAKLQELRVNPFDYADAESLKKDLAVTEFLRKCELPGDKERKFKAAVKTFWDCETQNAKTNRRLDRFVHHGPYEVQDEALLQFIAAWRKQVDVVLGRLPERLVPRFSGGATYSDTSKRATPPDKMTNRATFYPSSECLLPFWWVSAWGRTSLRNAPRGVRGNVFFTVPKDGTKDRGCAKEASINVALQLDVGAFLKDRLTLFGVNLRTGQELHKKLAQKASCDGLHATIDLSNASDTLCYNLVKLLLSSQWFDLFDSLRAPFTRVEGRWVRLEKFSSMGNGFTFELETLIFWTLAETLRQLSATEGACHAYGDDLIVPTSMAPALLKALELFGFTPNVRKTFLSGSFRESCGGDYFNGVSVRAHYLEKLPDEPQEWISLANGLRRLGDIGKMAWMECLKNIPSSIRRLRGPSELGDVVIHDDPEHWDMIYKVPRGEAERVHHVRAYVPLARVDSWSHWTPDIQFASCLLGLPSRGVTPRGAITGYKVRAIPMPGNKYIPARIRVL
jgi:hypothetical protein